MNATVEITDVYTDAIRIPRTDLRVGDTVFDATGGRHTIIRVRHFKHTTVGLRDDKWPVRLYDDEDITIERAAP